MAVVLRTAVKNALDTLLPGQLGPGRRWEDGFIDLLIDIADAEIREYCELSYADEIITPTDDTGEYELSENTIAVYQVEWAVDGSDYDTELMAVDFDDLDQVSRLWRDDVGTWPQRYTITSTPGIPIIDIGGGGGSFRTRSTIIIYPKVSTAGSARLKVRSLAMATLPAAARADQVAVDNVYVPLILSMLTAAGGPRDHATYQRQYGRYLDGRDELRSYNQGEYAESLGRLL